MLNRTVPLQFRVLNFLSSTENFFMNRFLPRFLALALIIFGIGLLSSTAIAQDRPIRQWLKERAIAREQQKADPDSVSNANARITKPGNYSFTIQHNGLTRRYLIHVPAQYDPAKPAPLLFALHGGGGSMEHMADDANYDLISMSDRHGLVVVFPNGFSKLKTGKFATWNAGNCCAGARDEKIDDVGFIRQIVDNVTHQMSIDRNRVYATGMSNGGMMAYQLACDMSDIFNGIAAVAGTDNTINCMPKNPVPILHIHARNDTHVLFAGGAGEGLSDKSKVTEFTSVAETVSKWLRLNGCSPVPRRDLETEGAYCEVYSQCKENSRVELCVTETGAHSWPGADKTRGESASQAISANEIMWNFFNHP